MLLERYLVGLHGLEPWTPCMSCRCSNQLSYSPKKEAHYKQMGAIAQLLINCLNRAYTSCDEETSAARLFVISRADISLLPLAFWPHHRGEKSAQPSASATLRTAEIAVPAIGNSGVCGLIGPNSRTARLTMLRAGRPENTLVRAVWEDASLLMAAR